ncbi:hypothetical protein ACIHEJ_20100 [Streptomyces sp. NPDC052301]|uniref:hypothetical protein n=1 Tax=Streptomyces sp. NPDC052301 TaxID=3365687 RepID=UPI0037CE52C4
MYLIHVPLRAPAFTVLPSDAAGIFASFKENGDGIEHVAAHPDAPGGPTLGFFVVSCDLATAEQAVFRLSRRAVAEHAALQGFTVVSGNTAFVPESWWDGK